MKNHGVIFSRDSAFKTNIILAVAFIASVGMTGFPLIIYPKYVSLKTALHIMFFMELMLGILMYFIYFMREDNLIKGIINKNLLIKGILVLLGIQLLVYASEPHNIGSVTLTSDNALSLLMIIIFIPFYEEVLYRGCLFSVLRSIFRGSLYFPYVITSAIFCAMHTQYQSPIYQAALFSISLTLIYVRIKSKSIIHAIVLHASMNLFFVILNMQRVF